MKSEVIMRQFITWMAVLMLRLIHEAMNPLDVDIDHVVNRENLKQY